MPRVLVTTGSTREPIDSVRFLTNFSGGRLGYEIARAFAAQQADVTVLCPKETPFLAAPAIAGVRHKYFTNHQSLDQLLFEDAEQDIIIHAAAVSDFCTGDRVTGKFPSDRSFTINLIPTEKLIEKLRHHFGKRAFLVGFKLLVGANRNARIVAGIAQNKRSGLNLTVVNDRVEIREDEHPATIVTAEGGALELWGTKQEVAQRLVEFIRKRAAVRWFTSSLREDILPVSGGEREKFATALHFAQESHLLYDTSGNVSLHSGDALVVTPRQVDKRIVRANHCSQALVDLERRRVWYAGTAKPSIDTGMQGILYRYAPRVQFLLHFHTHWGLFTKRTSFPYPCGVSEEADEIIRTVGPVKTEFAVELLHHGALVGVDEKGLARLAEEWRQCRMEYVRHLTEVDKGHMAGASMMRPIFADTHIVGVFWMCDGYGTFYLSRRARGRRVGDAVIRQIIQRQTPMRTIDACAVVPFYERYGFDIRHCAFDIRQREDSVSTMLPPKREETDELFDRIEEWRLPRGRLWHRGANYAADMLVTRFENNTGLIEMLAVRRRDTKQWAIPGGMVEGSVAQTLARELFEETGVLLDEVKNAKPIYRGVVADPRNNEEAWVETTVAHLHLPDGFRELDLKAGDDAESAAWHTLNPYFVDRLYAGHGEFVRLALKRLLRQISSPDARAQIASILTQDS